MCTKDISGVEVLLPKKRKWEFKNIFIEDFFAKEN